MIDYDAHDWRSHLCDIRGSMVREIFGRVSACVAWSVMLVILNEWLVSRYEVSLAISLTGHTLIGVALGLLLVFRTNSSYDRFWEGRKLWGAIVNETRNLARGASVHLAADRELFDRVVGWTIAFAWSSMFHLTGRRSLGDPSEALPAEEVRQVLEAGHVPLAVACRLSEQLVEARRRELISDYVLVNLDQNVQLLIDYLGGCERIRNTPLPFAYVVHLRRALIAYCFTLPMALLDAFGWETVPATFVIAYIMFGIEEIGVEIEGPFGEDDNDLPLDQLCRTIETNLRAIAPASVCLPQNLS